MTDFVCDNCGAVNTNPEYLFSEYKGMVDWEWVCNYCTVTNFAELMDVSEIEDLKKKLGVQND